MGLNTFTHLKIGFRPTGPIRRTDAPVDVTMKRRIRPIGNPFDIAMFDRVDMTIIDVCGVILIVADCVLPKPPLPYSVFASGDAYR